MRPQVFKSPEDGWGDYADPSQLPIYRHAKDEVTCDQAFPCEADCPYQTTMHCANCSLPIYEMSQP